MKQLKYCNIDEESNVLSPSKHPCYPDGYLGDFLVKKLQEHADQEILVDGYTGETLKGEQIKNMTINFASSLVKMGVQEGDTVVGYMSNNIRYAPVQFGTVAAGAASAGIYGTHPYSEYILHSKIISNDL